MTRFYNMQFPAPSLTLQQSEALRHDLEFVLGDYGIQPADLFVFITENGRQEAKGTQDENR